MDQIFKKKKKHNKKGRLFYIYTKVDGSGTIQSIPCYLVICTLRVGQDIALIFTCYVTALTFLWSHISFPVPALFVQCTVTSGSGYRSPQHLQRRHFCFERCRLFPMGTSSSQQRGLRRPSASPPPRLACAPGASASASPLQQAPSAIFNCTVLIRSKERKAGQKNKQSKKGYFQSGRQSLLQTRTSAG